MPSTPRCLGQRHWCNLNRFTLLFASVLLFPLWLRPRLRSCGISLYVQLEHLFVSPHRIEQPKVRQRSITRRSAQANSGEADVLVVTGYDDAVEQLSALYRRDPGEARSAYRRLVGVMHPDVAGDDEATAEKFRGLVRAWEEVEKNDGMLEATFRTGRARRRRTDAEVAEDLEYDRMGIPRPVRRDVLDGTEKRDGWQPGAVNDGEVVIYKLKDEDLERLGLEPGPLCPVWGLAVVSCQQIRYDVGAPGGFVYALQLVFEEEYSSGDRVRRGWLVADDEDDLILVDPLEELEALKSEKIPRYGYALDDNWDEAEAELTDKRYGLTVPIDTRYVYTGTR